MSWMMEEFCNSWQEQENFLSSETCLQRCNINFGFRKFSNSLGLLDMTQSATVRQDQKGK
jgi:hypothetical protein